MPERPDLLSSLAHELAHYEIHARYSDFWSPFLDVRDDSFARLAKLLNNCFESFGIKPSDEEKTVTNRPEFALPEIGCDLLADVEGHAYLEVTTCELPLAAPNRTFDLDIRPDINVVVDHDSIGRSWYFRLKLLCTWLEKIPHHPLDVPTNILIRGIRGIVESILAHLAELSPLGDKTFWLWRALTDELCKIVSHSSAAREVAVTTTVVMR